MSSQNESGLEPLGKAVLVRMIQTEQHKGAIVIPEHVRASSSALEQKALVIEVGATAWSDEPKPRAKAGDKVFVTKFAGFIAKGPGDGKIYRLVNANDIFCRITSEAFEEAERNEREVANG